MNRGEMKDINKDLEIVLGKFESRKQRRLNIEQLFRFISVVGIFVFLVMAVLFSLRRIEANLRLSQEEAILIMGALIGLFFSAFSSFIVSYKKLKSKGEYTSNDILPLVFLSKWNNFEKISDQILNIDENYNKGIRHKIDLLLEKEFINKTDSIIIYYSIQTRNKIVHGNEKIDVKGSEFLLKGLGEITQKLNQNYAA